jgi:uncharacterized membrane protein YeaQ/YmgE (transglycosylase-associated protein family)
VPVCSSCADRHRAEWKPIGFFERIWPALKSEKTIAFIFPFLGALFFFSKVLEDAARGNFTRAAVMMAPVLFFGSIAGFLWKQILDTSQQYGIPPDTAVSGSFSFSSRKKRLFEPERRRFEFHNERFAKAFVEANRSNLWDPRSPEAINARNSRTLLQYGLIAVVVLFVAGSVIADWLR